MPKLSIIIPVYNTEKYVEECISSVLSQTSDDFELIVVDDGSCDRSVETVAKLINGKANCKLLKNNHKGVCGARNSGIDIASGDYICFVDSDDVLFPDYVESIVKASEIYNSDVIYFYALYGTDKNRTRAEVKDLYTVLTKEDTAYLSAAALYHTPEVDNKDGKYHPISSFSAWMQVYKASLYKENNIRYAEGIKRSEDGLLNLEILNYAESGVIIKKPLYIYRTDNVSATRSYISDLTKVFDLRDSCVKAVIERLYSDRAERYTQNYLSSLIYQIRVIAENQIFNDKNPQSKAEKMSEFEVLLSKPDYKQAIDVCSNYYLAPEDRSFLELLRGGDYRQIPKTISKRQIKAKIRSMVKKFAYPVLKALGIR